MNLVERSLGELTTKWLRRGTHNNIPHLRKSIRQRIDTMERKPKPYRWHNTADQIIESIRTYCERMNNAGR